MKTDTAERVLEQARQILQQEKDGHSPGQERIDWAKSILQANALWKPKEPA